MSWKTAGLYVWRTRKPHAVVGLGLRWLVPASIVLAFALWGYGESYWWIGFALLLFSGRHTAYVGETSSRYHRDRQHRHGGGRWGAVRKDWMDLDPKVYPLPCLFPRSAWARKFQEKFWIFLLLPVYNVEWNTKNPRRIKPGKAEAQRWARDDRKVVGWLVPKLARAGLVLALAGGAYLHYFA